MATHLCQTQASVGVELCHMRTAQEAYSAREDSSGWVHTQCSKGTSIYIYIYIHIHILYRHMSAKSISSMLMHVQVSHSSVCCLNLLMLRVSTAIVQVPKIVQEAVSGGPLSLPISWLSPSAASCCWSIQVQKLGVMGCCDVREGHQDTWNLMTYNGAVEVALLRPVKKVLQREVEVRSCRVRKCSGHSQGQSSGAYGGLGRSLRLWAQRWRYILV